MKKLFIYWLLFLTWALNVNAQKSRNDYFNTDEFWQNIEYINCINTFVTIPKSDNYVCIISNRKIDTLNLRFAKEYASDTLNYFVAISKDNKWYLYKVPYLKSLLSYINPQNDVVIYTEGFGKLFTSGISRAFAMANQHNIEVLYLDYPSYQTQKSSFCNWTFVNNSAKKFGKQLIPIFDSLKIYQSEIQFPHLSLFYHSMGNLALEALIKNQNKALFNKHKWIDNLILNVACVPSRKSKKWLSNISFCKRIYVHYNTKDQTLQLAKIRSGNKKLGQKLSQTLPNINYINFNPMVNKEHNYFLNFKFRDTLPVSIFNYMSEVIHGQEINFSNLDKFEKTKPNKNIFKIKKTE